MAIALTHSKTVRRLTVIVCVNFDPVCILVWFVCSFQDSIAIVKLRKGGKKLYIKSFMGKSCKTVVSA